MEEKVTITGTVKRIIYKNEQNGYMVLALEKENSSEVCVTGIFFKLAEKDVITIVGEYIEHKTYGRQIKADHYELYIPKDAGALEEYLAKGMVKGIGPVLAKRIISKFGTDALDIMTNSPERLCEVEGIGKRSCKRIARSIEERTQMQKAMIFLANYGISQAIGMKIYRQYKEEMYRVLETNPYQIADDIKGIGFLAADKIALANGIPKTSDFRLRSGIRYVLEKTKMEGHICYPYDLALEKAIKQLDVSQEILTKKIQEMVTRGSLVSLFRGEIHCLYQAKDYRMETATACMIMGLIRKMKAKEVLFDDTTLDDIQRSAVTTAAESGFMVLTGGPGTGKTTTTNLIIQYFKKLKKRIALAAPTGRAAKRMQEATGYEAKTIHRLLEVKNGGFQRNEENPLECDVLIVDEVSMLDLSLMHSLLLAVPVHARVILVGDKNQLPSVGAGNVLSDIIRSGLCPVVELKKIYRQAEGSDIISNAHKILKQEALNLSNRSKDFFFKAVDSAEEIQSALLHYVADSLPGFTGESEIQVLAPVKKRSLGVEALNLALQERLNPGQETVMGFRLHDKVIQTRNDYRRTRTLPDGKEVEGVFNGDVGRIVKVDHEEGCFSVRFEDDSIALYDFDDLDDLMLSYALTIHKSQGSEYPVVVIPVYDYIPSLTTMNLIYTAVTRAKKYILLIGRKNTLYRIIHNVEQARRYTGLAEEMEEAVKNQE